MRSTSFNAAYGHGVRYGKILTGHYSGKRVAKRIPAPSWMPTRLHRFVWRAGFRNAAGYPTLISQLTLMFIGE